MKLHEVMQEAFDIGYTQMMTQMERSREEKGWACLYRGPRGLKGPVGALIKDEFYRPSLEKKAVDSNAVYLAIKNSHPEFFKKLSMGDVSDFLGFLDKGLSIIHNTREPEEWGQHLYYVARRYDLAIPMLPE